MLSPEEVQSFFVSPSAIDRDRYAVLKYLFETAADPKQAAATLCCEQSTAQWRRPGRDEDFRTAHGAKVLSLTPADSSSAAQGRGSYLVEVAHPVRNFGPRLPNFLSVAAGEGPFYCPGISTIRWLDFRFPEDFLKQFEGPQFGLAGLRRQIGVEGRPFFIGVVKPNLGLSPADFAEIAHQGWIGGLDIAKDDEMLADVEWSPLKERALHAGRARLRAERETGKKKMYVANITDEVDRIGELHDLAVGKGANAVMINAILTGLSALRVLRKRARVPVMSHFGGTACLSRTPNFGISSLVLTKLQRLAGADIIGLAGFGERMRCPDKEVLENIRACLEPWGPIGPALPVPGGSDTAETLATVFKKIGHTDFGFISGRGVFGHPAGPAAGAGMLHEAWERLR